MGLAMRLHRDKRGSLATIFPLSNGNDVIIPMTANDKVIVLVAQGIFMR